MMAGMAFRAASITFVLQAMTCVATRNVINPEELRFASLLHTATYKSTCPTLFCINQIEICFINLQEGNGIKSRRTVLMKLWERAELQPETTGIYLWLSQKQSIVVQYLRCLT